MAKGIRGVLLAGVLLATTIQATEENGTAPTETQPHWSAHEFLSRYLATNEDLIQAQSRLEVSHQTWLAADDLYSSSFSLTPTSHWKDQTFTSGAGQSTYDDRSSDLVGRFVQTFPSGSELEFKAQGYMERANPTLGGIDRQYSLTLNQPLWQNSFGRQIRLERDRALHSYESEQGSYSSSRLITCETGLKLYFAAFSAQEAERDYALILNSAEKALEI
ncbi:MAG: hypothetical protein KDD43_14360, partial [Bdellovibrionales bacterium]|nr:hypothetical protein [Bdellovibrionales bacterium]